VPTDPYVPVPLDEKPRQQQNFAPGVFMPPARAWVADRPGDVRARPPRGPLTGTPGPNVGFALSLARRARDRFRLEPGEHVEDAVAVVAELAMKRASTFGRAPTILDVDFAIELLGYAGAAPEDVRRWRPGVVRGADHDYVVRRAIADTVGSSLLRITLAELPEHLAAVRSAIASGAVADEDTGTLDTDD
jgi:hypothetical protein